MSENQFPGYGDPATWGGATPYDEQAEELAWMGVYDEDDESDG